MIVERPVVVVIGPAVTVIGIRVFTVNPHRNTGWRRRADDAPCGD
jgi:hypothetical protein